MKRFYELSEEELLNKEYKWWEREDQSRLILAEIKSEFQLPKEMHQPKKNVILFYTFKGLLMVVAIEILLVILLGAVVYFIAFLPIPLTLGYLKWKHAGFAYNEDYVYNRYLRKFTVHTMVTKKEYLQTTTITQNFLEQRKGVHSYHFAV
ncbi:putative membrane protein YdbT with pleckstrin-like domain [Evansella vedderi]|uniref:Membrane protein YdbT with pleckstrin-like domain n=1 Tax=Evansella vedderi TaxID=38282 RepID=A0ABT9ZUA9_9BACI|nr:hypothetical protein [Evansella vedderi]MDQ0254818.1 putative membrane protein YdbT with pleckstrin-like domain [Evansella vedderi]